MQLSTPIAAMRQAVTAAETRSLAWRLEQLQRLEQAVNEHRDAVLLSLIHI